ncbi:EAL domain-containing protein [Candidatus Dependentiae bacterium]|nr:EAL domain-containing protein [Candidatus Dependentiae bacterium]
MNEQLIETSPNSYYSYLDKGIDKLTKLPLLNSILDETKTLFKNSPNFGLVYINVAKFNEIEINYGEKVFDNLLLKTSELLKNMKGTIIRNNDIISITRMWDDDFIIFLSPPRYQEKIRISDVNEIKNRIEKYLKSNKNKIISRGLEYQFDFYLGYSIIDLNREIKFERTVYTNLKNAMMMAYDKESQVSLSLQSEFKEIIAAENINVIFQPIVDLEKHKIIGYEALARGPQNSMLNKPVILFNMAYQTNKIWELERIVRKKALALFFSDKNHGMKFLSLNVEPKTFSDPEFRKYAEMNPDNIDFSKIILEITERTNITDLQKFKEQLQLFKNCKFTVAIDDAGSGYASLFYIAELKPDIIKLDISLVKNINENNPRSDIVKALVKFASQHNIKVLAEGIETPAELNEIKKIGILLGQGFYFSEGKQELLENLRTSDEQ